MEFNLKKTPRKSTITHSPLEQFDLYFEELPETVSSSNYAKLKKLFKRAPSRQKRLEMLQRRSIVHQ